MKKADSLELLKVHRRRLADATNFEEYRNAHVAYVDMLIERYQHEEARDSAIQKFIDYAVDVVLHAEETAKK